MIILLISGEARQANGLSSCGQNQRQAGCEGRSQGFQTRELGRQWWEIQKGADGRKKEADEHDI